MKNYYEELGVSKNADISEIKQSYLNLIKKYHPDLYQGDKTFAEMQTQKLNQIYNTLKNQESRKKYDISQGFYAVVNVEQQTQPKKKESSMFSDFRKRVVNNFSYEKVQEQDRLDEEYRQKIKKEKLEKKLRKKAKKYGQEYVNKKIEIIEKQNANKQLNKKEKIKFNLMLVGIFLAIIGILLLIIIL